MLKPRFSISGSKKRLVLSFFLLGLVSAQAQTFLTRAELKKPLSEAVEKALAEFVDRCAVEKKKQLSTHMEAVLKSVDAAAKLSADERSALVEPTHVAVEAAVQKWKPEGIVAMRTYLNRTSEIAATRHINQWKPELAGLNEPVENWKPPHEDAAWLAAVRKILGEPRFKAWIDAHAQVRKKTEAEINGYLERWVRESRGPMNEDLQAKIELMKKKLGIGEEQVAALKKAAERLLDEIVTAEKKRAAGMLRSMPQEARKNIMGRSYFYVRFDRPRGEAWDKRWEQAAAKALSADLIAKWSKTSVEERGKEEAELESMIRPSEIYLRQQMEVSMLTEIDNITAELGLDKVRQEKLKKLSDEAIEESLKLGRKQWLQQARNYSATERQRVRGNTYFGLGEEQQAPSLAIWKEGLKKVLTDEERTKMAQEKDGREERSLRAISRACLAEMDQTLMLNDEQRRKLEPLLKKQLEPLLEQRRQQYWSYSPQQLFQNAGKLPAESVRTLLDERQWKRWQALVSVSSASRTTTPTNGTQPEVPDMEAAIAQHLHKMFVAERQKVLNIMMAHVEEAGRVLALPEKTMVELTTAAKGAVEESLSQWRRNTERYVRQAVETATAKNVLQALAGTARVNFSRNDESRPENMEVWQSTLEALLDEPQRQTLEKTKQARSGYRLRAMAGMTVAELDRRRHLNAVQCARLEPVLEKVLEEYRPDIERYMSANWFLQYYYAMVPVAGVPEKDLQAILTPEQWKSFKDRDLPDAMQYWEGIENNHKNRQRQGANGNGNRIIFNGGLMIDQ